MKNQLKVKVCGLKEETNIQQVASLSPDFLGFIYYPKSKRFVGNHFPVPTLTENQKKVAVLVNEPLKSAIKIFSEGYDFLQIHGDEPSEYCKELHTQNIPIIKAFGLNEDFDFSILTQYQPYVNYFLFDTKSTSYGGTGKKFNWNLLKKYLLDTPFLLSGGISPKELDTLLKLEHPQFYGVDLNSGFEISPGLKNIDDLDFFITALKKSL